MIFIKSYLFSSVPSYIVLFLAGFLFLGVCFYLVVFVLRTLMQCIDDFLHFWVLCQESHRELICLWMISSPPVYIRSGSEYPEPPFFPLTFIPVLSTYFHSAFLTPPNPKQNR